MLESPQEFAASSNGDRWLLERDRATGDDIVVHRANPASGGMETRMTVPSFLQVTGDRPEANALREILQVSGSRKPQSESRYIPPEEKAANRSPWFQDPHGSSHQS
jgi:hypothetical protein